MSQVVYVNMQSGAIQTTEPSGVTIIKAEFPEGTDAGVALPLLMQDLQSANAKNLNPNYSPPALAYRIQFGE